jgi:hypothetical protein
MRATCPAYLIVAKVLNNLIETVFVKDVNNIKVLSTAISFRTVKKFFNGRNESRPTFIYTRN